MEDVVGENNGTGVSRKFILASTLSKTCKYSPEGMSYAIPQPTIEYAMLCLQNAIFLLPKNTSEDTNLPIANLSLEDSAKKTMIGQQQSSFLGTLASSAKLGNNAFFNFLCKIFEI